MDAWGEIALPALHWISERESIGIANIGTMADELGVDPLALANELDRLVDSGFVAGEVHKAMTGGDARPWHLLPVRLAERGARAVGMWPSGDAGEVMLQVLRRAQESETDPERRGKLTRAADALGGLAKDFVTELAVSITKGAAGLP